MEMVWTDDALADLCDCLESKENLGHAIARTVIQSFLYPHVSQFAVCFSSSRELDVSFFLLGHQTDDNSIETSDE